MNRIVTQHGVWRVGVQRGARIATLEGARGTTHGMSGPLATGMLRSRVALAVRSLLEALYPNAEHHSDRVVPHEVMVILRKPGAPETVPDTLDRTSYADLIGEEEP